MQNRKILISAIIFTIVLISYFGFFNQPKTIEKLKKEVAPTASLYEAPKDVYNVLNFINDYDNRIHLSEVSKNKWPLLYFGYTNCPHICPLDLQKLNTTSKKMITKDSLQVIFISIDPKRDIGHSDNFAKKFNDNFIGLNMPVDEIYKIGKLLGIYHQIIQTQQEANASREDHDESHNSMDNAMNENHDSSETKHYDMNHTTSYLLLNPNLELVAILSNPHNPEDMAKTLDNIIQNLR